MVTSLPIVALFTFIIVVFIFIVVLIGFIFIPGKMRVDNRLRLSVAVCRTAVAIGIVAIIALLAVIKGTITASRLNGAV